MAAVSMSTVSTVCAIIGVSVALVRSFEAGWLARRAATGPRVQRGKALPFSAGVLARGRLTEGEAVATRIGSGSRLRGRTILASPLMGALASRNWATLLVAFLSLAAAGGYMADGVAATHWVLPCVGIPVIVALVNLLGPSNPA